MSSCIDKLNRQQDRSLWQQLLIVGSGFDKECGLRSGFSDFHEERRRRFDSLGFPCFIPDERWADSVERTSLTAWDIAL